MPYRDSSKVANLPINSIIDSTIFAIKASFCDREPQRRYLFTDARYAARCLGSQNAAALPCLTQRVKHLDVFQVLSTGAYEFKKISNHLSSSFSNLYHFKVLHAN